MSHKRKKSNPNYLDRFADQMIGIHFHGLKALDDYLAPFSGNFDFSKISLCLSRNNLIKVIEVNSKAIQLK